MVINCEVINTPKWVWQIETVTKYMFFKKHFRVWKYYRLEFDFDPDAATPCYPKDNNSFKTRIEAINYITLKILEA